LSVEAFQESETCPGPGLAARLPGTLGGVVSPVTEALASFEGAERLPAASSASTL
jgi:hypothetical protein